MRCHKRSGHIAVNPNELVVYRDETVEFSKDEIKHLSRRIEYWEENKKTSSVLLTNNFDLKAEEIIAIYLRRWQIETLFKFAIKILLWRKY